LPVILAAKLLRVVRAGGDLLAGLSQ